MKYLHFSVLSVCIALASCSKLSEPSATPSPEVKFMVEEAPEWTALFKRSEGWFGGDGIFAIPYSGVDVDGTPQDSTLFLFSDTMVGTIKDNVLQPGYKMVNNSVMVLTGREAEESKARFI